MSRLFACLLFILLLAPIAARGTWEISSREQNASPNESVMHRRTTLADDETGARATLDCAIFSSTGATLEVVDQPHLPRQDLAGIMSQSAALAGVNGGYFDPEDAPVGLLVSHGKMISPLRKAKLLSGVLFSTGDKVDIVRAAHFAMSKKIRAAVQCGPLLVERGAPIAGLNDSRVARRTFALVDENGHAALGRSSALSLAQLSRVLLVSHLLGELKTARALNLDGGSSSAFWFAGKERTISLPELKTVRDFIIVLPRKSR
jgi:hypothetical protein